MIFFVLLLSLTICLIEVKSGPVDTSTNPQGNDQLNLFLQDNNFKNQIITYLESLGEPSTSQTRNQIIKLTEEANQRFAFIKHIQDRPSRLSEAQRTKDQNLLNQLKGELRHFIETIDRQRKGELPIQNPSAPNQRILLEHLEKLCVYLGQMIKQFIQAERNYEKNEFEKLIKKLDVDKQNELEQRSKEQPTKNRNLQEQRIREQTLFDNYDKIVREQIQLVLIRHNQELPMDGDHIKQVGVVNQNWQMLYTIKNRIDNRRKAELMVKERRESEQRDLQTVIERLDTHKKSEQDHRALEQSIKNQNGYQEIVKLEVTLDQLEQKIRDQVRRIQERHLQEEPLNEEHTNETRLLTQLFGELRDKKAVIEKLRIPLRRIEEENKLKQIIKTLDEYNSSEPGKQAQELPPKDLAAQAQRTEEQRVRKFLDKEIRDKVQRIQQKFTQGQNLTPEHVKEVQELNDHWTNFMSLMESIDKRRKREQSSKRSLAKQKDQLEKLLKNLDEHEEYEKEQRAKEKPARDSEARIQRKKDEFTEDKLVKEIRTRIKSLQERIAQEQPIDHVHKMQRNRLNNLWEKLELLTQRVEERRSKEKSSASESPKRLISIKNEFPKKRRVQEPQYQRTPINSGGPIPVGSNNRRDFGRTRIR